MARKRELKKNNDLPKYVYWKNGAYRLLYEKEPDKWSWIFLSRTKPQAIAEYYRISPETIKVVTMADLIDRYLKEEAPKKAVRTYKENIKQSVGLKCFFGEMLPSAVKAVHVYQYLDARGIKAANPAPRSANLEKGLLSHIFTMAIRWGIVEANPCIGVRALKYKKQEKRYITDEEFWAVHSLASLPIQLMMELAWITGLRRGDLVKVKKSDITEAGVEVAVNKVSKKVILVWTPALRQWYERTKLIKTPILSIFLMPNEKGLQYTEDGFSTVFYKLVRKAIKLGLIKEPFGIHDIRAKALSDADELYGREFARQQGAHSTQKMTAHYVRKPLKIKSWK